MNIQHEDWSKMRSHLREIFSRHLGDGRNRVFVFGSRVAGATDDRGDIDIGILGDGPVSSEVMERLQEELSSLPTLYTFDLVDFAGVSDDFKAVALKHIEEIV